MKIIIYDFEVFKYDVLFGAYIVNADGSKILYQSWDLEEIRGFYEINKNNIWIGHNIKEYDNLILQSIVEKKSNEQIKKVNDDIIKLGIKPKLYIQLYYYDLILNHFESLKAVEASVGKNISESEIDFNIDRPLTYEEKQETMQYNKDDLDQTYDDFEYLFDEFQLRLEIIKEFNLDISCISLTGTQVAERVLNANRIYNIENQVIKPYIYENLNLKNSDLIDYYLKEKFKTDEKLEIYICGVKHNIGNGGIHGAKENIYCKEALYLDVSGYYNLIMLNFNLLPRTIPESGKQLYRYMYEQQLALKGKPELAMKRGCYKTILLAVFGGMLNQYTNFYDPYKGDLVTITGQLFIVDLLEKLEGKINLIQSNTDGIMVVPSENSSEEEILQIVKDWCERTGFVIKPKKIYNIYQRDVNNYMYQSKDGEIEVKGEALKHYECNDNPFITDIFKSKEPPIIAKGIVNYFVYNKTPEETIDENKSNLKAFQFICKKGSYDYIEYEESKLFGDIISYRLQNVNRVFAMKQSDIKGMIYKFKLKNGKTSKSRFPSLPNSIFVYNNEIFSEDSKKIIEEKIDYIYYIKRIYERILEFLPNE